MARKQRAQPQQAPSAGRRRGRFNDRFRPRKYTRINVENIDYKDLNTLRRFISDRGKIRARRVTGVSAQEQRLIAKAVKNAREMALLPYSSSAR